MPSRYPPQKILYLLALFLLVQQHNQYLSQLFYHYDSRYHIVFHAVEGLEYNSPLLLLKTQLANLLILIVSLQNNPFDRVNTSFQSSIYECNYREFHLKSLKTKQREQQGPSLLLHYSCSIDPTPISP